MDEEERWHQEQQQKLLDNLDFLDHTQATVDTAEHRLVGHTPVPAVAVASTVNSGGGSSGGSTSTATTVENHHRDGGELVRHNIAMAAASHNHLVKVGAELRARLSTLEGEGCLALCCAVLARLSFAPACILPVCALCRP